MPQFRRHRDPIHRVLNHLLSPGPFEDIFDVQDNPMTENVRYDHFHIVGNDKISTMDESHAPGDLQQSQTSPWAGAHRDARVVTSQPHQLGNVVNHDLVNVDIQLNTPLQLQEPFNIHCRLQILGRIIFLPLNPTHQYFILQFSTGRVTGCQTEEKAI